MKKIDKIKSGLVSRNLSLLKYGLKSGMSFIKNRDNPSQIIEDIVGKSPEKLVEQFSHFKGSIQKAGQLLSQYGEYYLPKEINTVLKKLQSSTHFLDFKKLKKNIPDKALSEFEFIEEPLAAASIGQVHKAVHKESRKVFVFKLQYDGIEKAIKNDLVFIRFVFNSLKVIPKGIDTEDVFNEIERVLKDEMDYEREAKIIQKYKDELKDSYYYVPQVYPEYSNNKCLCMEFLEGASLSDVQSLLDYKDNKDLLGEKVFELFLHEVFHFGLVQSDAHGGNYLVSRDFKTLNLLDFGACLDFDEEVLKFYRGFLKYSYEEKRTEFFQHLQNYLDFTNTELSYDEELFWQYVLKISEPLRSKNYHWGKTILPDELLEMGMEMQKTLKFKSIPAQFIFIDRKTLGVFTILKSLKSEFNVNKVFLKVAYKDSSL